jgi:hypothetical protein
MGIRSEAVDQKYIFEYEVGIWSFGTVQVLKDKGTHDLRSCKTVAKSLLQNASEVVGRLRKLQRLNHAYINSVTDVLEDKNYIFIISEKTAGNDIAEWLERTFDEGNWIQEQTCAAYLRQTLIATAHSHACRVFHRELQPSTLVLTSKLPDASVKVSDFGLAVVLDPSCVLMRKNPHPYVAPELLSDNGERISGGSADMWSIGAIAHALLVGRPPKGSDARGRFSKTREDAAAWAERSHASRDFVRRLLAAPGERLTAARALKHPWLRGSESVPGAVPDGVGERARMLSYMLALLLVPEVMDFKPFHQMRTAFTDADEDRDGLVLSWRVKELLIERGASREAAVVAIEVSDVLRSSCFDLSAIIVAQLIVQEIGDNPVRASDIASLLLKRFLNVYGNLQNGVVSIKQLRSRLCTATGREMETKAHVNYDEMLSPFPEDAVLGSNTLVNDFSSCEGRGTPLQEEDLSEDEDDDPEGSCGLAFGMDRFDEFFAQLIPQLMESCGRGRTGRSGAAHFRDVGMHGKTGRKLKR